MSRPISAFLNEVVQYLEEELLPDAFTETRYFDNCVTRVNLDDRRVSIQNITHCVKDQDEQIVRINDVLRRSTIQIEFQTHGNRMQGAWSEGLSQCTIGLHIPTTDTPVVFKWEQRGEASGVLKADEWFDHEREYIEQDIGAKAAIKRGIWEHFETTVPSFQEHSETSLIPPELVQTLYNDDHKILEELKSSAIR